MMTTGRVNPLGFDKNEDLPLAAVERKRAYQVDDEINEKDSGERSKARRLVELSEVRRPAGYVFFIRLALVFTTVMSVLSITTFVLILLVISGRMGYNCSCSGSAGIDGQNKHGCCYRIKGCVSVFN